MSPLPAQRAEDAGAFLEIRNLWGNMSPRRCLGLMLAVVHNLHEQAGPWLLHHKQQMASHDMPSLLRARCEPASGQEIVARGALHACQAEPQWHILVTPG